LSHKSLDQDNSSTDEYTQFIDLPMVQGQVQFLGNLLTHWGSEHKALWAETDCLQGDMGHSALNTPLQDPVTELVEQVKSLKAQVADLEEDLKRERIARHTGTMQEIQTHQALSERVH
jgi:hypothetical protein